MYGGDLVFATHDRYGKIQVVDFEQQFRSLHFNTKTQQSAMLLQNPFILLHKYTQAMVLPMALSPISNVLMLGLGAGSIVKFFSNYFPDVTITALELREAVVDIAHEFFLLPEPGEHFKLYTQDSLQWIEQSSHGKAYDLVLVDMFLSTSTGRDRVIEFVEQLESLLDCMSEKGVMVFNHLHTQAESSERLIEYLKAMRLFIYQVKIDQANTVLYASRVPFAKLTDKALYAFEQRASLPASSYYNNMTMINNK